MAIIACLQLSLLNAFAQDSLSFSGELIGWTNINTGNDLPLWFGGRYIPELDYSIRLSKNRMIDFDGSANIFGTMGLHPFDSINASGRLKPYRFWARYSTRQFELRLGLQKINFGSANILRPLMWFDRIDPRDPLQLTDGVWGALGRYYFLNNANIWLWCLYGNNNPKGWEFAGTTKNYPELGGRFQYPVPKGEIALSYHHRYVNTTPLESSFPAFEKAPENRIGLDGRWDLGIGLWFEGAWINNEKNLGPYTNQKLCNIGTDNTFGVGKGIHAVLEQLFVSYIANFSTWTNSISFTGLTLSYPAGIFDNLSTIFYYDWTHKSLYNFFYWQRQYNKITIYFMAYWNPRSYNIPLATGSENLYGGRGIQLMFVFNH